MKMHIEYDDFGEYVEYLDDLRDVEKEEPSQSISLNVKGLMRRLMLVVAAVTVMFSTSSYAVMR